MHGLLQEYQHNISLTFILLSLVTVENNIMQISKYMNNVGSSKIDK